MTHHTPLVVANSQHCLNPPASSPGSISQRAVLASGKILRLWTALVIYSPALRCLLFPLHTQKQIMRKSSLDAIHYARR